MIKTVLLIIITIFLPPVGVFLVAGCGADVLINILLTCLGYFPGHIHAFYVEYMYYKKRDEARAGVYSAPAPGVYSNKVQRGGHSGYASRPAGSYGNAGYGSPPVVASPQVGAPGYGTMPQQQAGFIPQPPVQRYS